MDQPEIGDYVLTRIEDPFADEMMRVDGFLQTNIAQVVGREFDSGKDERLILQFSEPSKDYLVNTHFTRDMKRFIDRNDITHWSKNKEDLEDFLAAKKYNL